MAALAMYRIKSAVVNDYFFFGEELERAVSRHIDGVSNVALNRWKNGDDRADFMLVGCIIDFLAYRKLRHRELLEIIDAIVSQQSERLDPTEVDSNVVLVWSPYLGLAAGELAPGTLME